MQKHIVWLAIVAVMTVSGCAGFGQRAADVQERVVDLPKVIWGNSTRALEEARAEAISKTFSCAFDACFDAVVALGDAWTAPEVVEEERENTVLTGMPVPDPGQKAAASENPGPSVEDAAATPSGQDEADAVVIPQLPYIVFFHDRQEQHVVVVGVPGSVDSTEVGIFFENTPRGVQVEIASLSSHAKRTVSASVFKALTEKFGDEVR